MTREILHPHFQVVGDVRGTMPMASIAGEPSLFSCTLEKAQKLGGDITAEVIEEVRKVCKPAMLIAYEAGLSEVIDVRVQRLMPGMFPSIPGWHCDAVPRANYFAQPDFSRLNDASFHVTCLVDTDESGHGIANTCFLSEPLDFEFDNSKPVWQQLHRQIESAPHRCRYVKPGSLVVFDSRTPHKATACILRGWRYFFRMSMYHNPPVVNGLQNAQQVYILSEENGW